MFNHVFFFHLFYKCVCLNQPVKMEFKQREEKHVQLISCLFSVMNIIYRLFFDILATLVFK